MNKTTLMCVAVVLASGCASLQVKKDKLAAVKKVAIVGYSGVVALDDGKAKGGIAGTIGAIKGSVDLMSGKKNERRVQQAEVGYAELSKRLGETLGVAVSERGMLAGDLLPHLRAVLNPGSIQRG